MTWLDTAQYTGLTKRLIGYIICVYIEIILAYKNNIHTVRQVGYMKILLVLLYIIPNIPSSIPARGLAIVFMRVSERTLQNLQMVANNYNVDLL